MEIIKNIRIKASDGAANSDVSILTDGIAETTWSTAFCEHAAVTFQIDLGQIANISAICVTPEQYVGQDISHNDRPAHFRIVYSLDGVGYSVFSEDMEIHYADFNDNSPKYLSLGDLTTRYIRLEILSPTGRRPDGKQRISLSQLEFLHGFETNRTLAPQKETIDAIRQALQTGTGSVSCFHLRGNLRRSFERLRTNEQTCVAYVGGSITEMDGWRNAVTDLIRERFPDNRQLQFLDCGISSYDSSCHAFRLQKDVFSHGKVDLMFLEAAVNDEYNGRTPEEIRYAFDGIFRQAFANNPNMDIVVLYFVDDLKIEEYQKTGHSHIIDIQEEVAAYYGISSIDLSTHVCQSMCRGDYDWKTFGGLHPAPFGHWVYADRIAELLLANWDPSLPVVDRTMPEPMEPDYGYCGRTLDIMQAADRLELHGFTFEDNWYPEDGISTRTDFADVPMLVGTHVGDSLRFSFQGSAILLFVASGPDSGLIRFRVDESSWKTTDLHTDWSDGLHLPWVMKLQNNLSAGQHQLDLEIVENPKAPGRTHAVIRYFLVKE